MQQFGAFGISLAFVTWFTGLAFLLVGAAVLGPVLSESESRLARWLRGGRNTVLEDGAPAAAARPGPPAPNLRCVRPQSRWGPRRAGQLTVAVRSSGQRQPSAGATWVRIDSMTCAL